MMKLRRDIQQCNLHGVSVFSDYQKSEMGTVKWRVLDQVANDIARNKGFEFMLRWSIAALA